MNREKTKRIAGILANISRHASDLDHHWCELATAGMDLTRSLAALSPDLPPDLLLFKERHGQFMRGSHGAAELALNAKLLLDLINPHPKGRNVPCRRG